MKTNAYVAYRAAARGDRCAAEPTEAAAWLRDDELYLGDNGRCFCGRLNHAGMTAYYTGRDRSGHPVRRVTETDQREARRLGVTLSCETCRVDPPREDA